MLRLSKADFEALRRHGEETYPYECCGVLLGRSNDNGDRIVTSIARCDNTRRDSPQNRYNIDPMQLIRLERESRERNEETVGFYHSHPDHPAQWSKTDLEGAHYLQHSYVITSVEKGRATVTNSFELVGSREEDKQFVAEKVEVDG